MPQSTSPRLLVLYHSTTGGTHQMAHALATAARQESGIEVDIRSADCTTADDILSAQGYVFATPEYLGSASGMMKDMFDRTYYEVLNKIEGRPYAIMVCAGSDGHGAVKQLERILTGWRLKPVAEPLIVNVAAQTPERILSPKHLSQSQLAQCTELGTLFAAGLGIGLF